MTTLQIFTSGPDLYSVVQKKSEPQMKEESGGRVVE